MHISPQGQRRSVDQNTLKRVRCLSNMPGFPRHTQSLGASRRRAGALPALSLDEFVACYQGKNSDESRASRHDRKPTWSEENPQGRWRAYDYEERKRDKRSLPS